MGKHMLHLQEPISKRYHLQHHLHHGMMSDVYLAYDEHLHCKVVMKLVSNDQTESRLRLQCEIQCLLTLSHDHIVPILDHGEYDTYHYLVLPYMEQGTLLKRISTGKFTFTEEEAGNILTQVTSALQCAHERGIVHRDIKPSNILLYHMLTGRPPFRGNSPLTVCWKHVRELPVPPSHLNPAITPAIEHVILRALQKDPQQRFPSAKALAQAYTNALQSSKHRKDPFAVPTYDPAQVASALHLAPHAATPTPLPTQTSHPLSGKTIPQQSTPSTPHQKHKHHHHQKNGNDTGT